VGPRAGMDPSSSSMAFRPVFGPLPPRSPSSNLGVTFQLHIWSKSAASLLTAAVCHLPLLAFQRHSSCEASSTCSEVWTHCVLKNSRPYRDSNHGSSDVQQVLKALSCCVGFSQVPGREGNKILCGAKYSCVYPVET